MKLVLAIAACALIACSGPKGVVLWHAYGGEERAALEATAASWNAAHPERLSLAQSGDDVPLSGEVAMREVLGAEVVLHVESAAGPLTVRTDAGAAPRPGDTVQVWLDPKAIHLFDRATEVRL